MIVVYKQLQYTYCPISHKGNQTMKFGQSIEYNKIFFFKNYAENEAERLVSDLFLFFKNV